MDIGISTACLYPEDTAVSLETLARLGVKHSEIFFNAPCEFEGDYFEHILEIVRQYEMDITAVHPFLSFAEDYMVYSAYYGRFENILEIYKTYFHATKMLGASLYIMHGAKEQLNIPQEEVFERYCKIAELGKSFGIRVAQENVVKYASQSPQFLKQMADYAGDLFSMVLDIKQAYRSKVSTDEFLNLLGEKIVHVHLSDRNDRCDCILPGTGDVDFSSLFNRLASLSYKGKAMIELYRNGYDKPQDLVKAKDFLQSLCV